MPESVSSQGQDRPADPASSVIYSPPFYLPASNIAHLEYVAHCTEEVQRLQAEEVRVLGSSSTGFDPRQTTVSASPSEQRQQQQPSEPSAQAPFTSAHAQPLFTWNVNQVQQPQQQQSRTMSVHSGGPLDAQAQVNGFSFATAASNGTFVFGQSPAFRGHSGAGDMTS